MAFFAEDVHLLARYLSPYIPIEFLIYRPDYPSVFSFCTVQVLMEGFLCGRLMKVLIRRINHR